MVKLNLTDAPLISDGTQEKIGSTDQESQNIAEVRHSYDALYSCKYDAKTTRIAIEMTCKK